MRMTQVVASATTAARTSPIQVLVVEPLRVMVGWVTMTCRQRDTERHPPDRFGFEFGAPEEIPCNARKSRVRQRDHRNADDARAQIHAAVGDDEVDV